MKITALKSQTKRPDRVSVYLDGAFIFSLTQNQLLEERLRVGLELDQPRVDRLKQLSITGKVYDRLLHYAMLRPHSRREMEQYVRRKQFDQQMAQAILQLLQEKGYVDDRHFTDVWLESRRRKLSSLKQLRGELRQKGIDDTTIELALAEGGYDEIAILAALIGKKRRQARYRDQEKLQQYLLRQGFHYEDITNALAQADSVS